MNNLIHKIKNHCQKEVEENEGENHYSNLSDGTNDICEGRLEFAEGLLEIIKKAKTTPIYYNITIPVSEGDGDDLRHGEEFSWSFCTKEDENIHIRTRIISEEEGLCLSCGNSMEQCDMIDNCTRL